jgi:4-amino-4-deoxy-L-arabinose transferase-like glycosyltransferase
MNRRAFVLGLIAIFATATVLRTLWLRSDPPTHGAIGISWHDEGPWVHNARNQALWGVWRTDDWNPVFVTPVFTALEYVAFKGLGVGTAAARAVPIASGLLAIAFLVAGLARVAGRRAALIGGAVLATDYVFVMWNRAALIESTMTAFMAIAWGCYALAGRRNAGGRFPTTALWGLAAGTMTVLAFFTKAAAAFFVAAVALDAIATIVLARSARLRTRLGIGPIEAADARAAGWTLAGVALALGAIAVLFVQPHWSEYYFYNVTMSVLRKPSYTLHDVIDRASWLPIVQSFFTRMWIVFVAALIAIAAVTARWRTARPAERLLVLWVLAGFLELAVHDSGNERRYLMFIPALTALAALFAGGATTLPPALASATLGTKLIAAPLLLFLGYLAAGGTLQLAFLDEIHAGVFRTVVRLSALAAGALTALIIWRWRPVASRLTRVPAPGVLAILVAVSVGWNLLSYALWTRERGELNYEASRAVGRLLPPGTMVEGKLANGLALDNQIRPIFLGNGFGNADRDDVRYILTYDLPSWGYESQRFSGLIDEILRRYPNRRVVARFEVDETPARDEAALVDKFAR